jgi:membrane protein YqaA with SNARE-associated domain
MKKRNQIYLFVFFVLVIAFFIFVLNNLSSFNNLVEKTVGAFGVFAVFLFSLLSDTLVQPIGPEVSATLGVAFGLNAYLVFLFSILGSLVGGLISFYVGRRFLLEKFEVSCSVKDHRRYCGLFEKYGKLSLAIAAITPLPYVLFVWMAGAFNLNVKDYLLYGFLPRVIRIGFVILIVAGIVAL